jgi:septum site-determining protein MinC
MEKEKEVVSYKGTRQGILMSISEEEPLGVALDILRSKIEATRSFFEGSPISLDLGWRELENEDLQEVLDLFKENNLQLLGIISCSQFTRKIAEGKGIKVIIGRLGLADHAGRKKYEKKFISSYERKKEETTTEPKKQDDEEIKYIKKTIRSGQTIEHPGNLIILGDVNPGAVVKAGGDVIIIGALRGVAQAGLRAKFEGPVIVAMKFQPTQISIRDHMINKFDSRVIKSKTPIIATLSDNKIAFEIYK